MAYANTISFEDRIAFGQDAFWSAKKNRRSDFDPLDLDNYESDETYDYDQSDDEIIGGIRFN